MNIGRRRLTTAAGVLALSLAAAACSPVGSSDRTLTVLAASSLTEAFTELADRFEAEHPGIHVRLSFGPSTTLAQQVLAGAPADVLATADEPSMAPVVDAGLFAREPVLFATNTLVVVTPAGNPARVQRVQDLANPSVAVALCAPDVPCGVAARRLLAVNDVRLRPVTLEPDVKAVLTKVSLGEVDAGLVYVTDATAAGDAVDTVAIPYATRVVNRYPIGVLTDAPETRAAEAWVELLLSAQGRQVLARAGFGQP